MPLIPRRAFLAATTVAPQLSSLLSAQRSQPLTRMQLSMPALGLTDAGLNFVKQLGVQWITMGGPGAPTYSGKDA